METIPEETPHHANCLTAPGPATYQFANAAKFAGWGFQIGPLNGKVPYTRHGFKNFTTDPSLIFKWWSDWPKANIGARPWTWAVVLDIDVRSRGISTWEDLNTGYTLPKTLVTETGSGGFHYWFKLPYRGKLKGTAGQGIDIKHNSGYLVMPGSIHPGTGNPYKCISWVAPLDLPVLPKHLRRHVFKPARPAPTVIPHRLRHIDDGGNLIQLVLDSQEGTRNINLNKAAFIAAKTGMNIFDDLADAARAVGCRENEINSTLRSARDAADRTAGTH